MAILPPLVKEAVERYKGAALERFPGRILEMRVFGSAARGEMHEHSDVDLWVLVDSRDRALRDGLVDLTVDVTEALRAPFFINAIIVDRARWADLESLERLIVSEVQRDGIPV
ncbi:MAG: nucleotidyltransferase family protein [Candidatus Xenobia bacterium]